jgi:hypothetical protein
MIKLEREGIALGNARTGVKAELLDYKSTIPGVISMQIAG